MSFKKDFLDASVDFEPFKKELLNRLKGEKIISVEMDGGALAKMFDKYSGIDYLHLINGNLRTIAMRVQWNVNYKTFTIRYSRKSGALTEYEKRNKAIFSNHGFLYPYLTMKQSGMIATPQ